MATYRDIFGVEAPKPSPIQLYREVYRAMGGSADARSALVEAGVVGPEARLGELNEAGNRLYAQLNEVERESEAADASAALDNLAAELEGQTQEEKR